MHGMHWTEEYVLYDLAVVKGGALCNWLREADPWSVLERASEGYISQEIDRRL